MVAPLTKTIMANFVVLIVFFFCFTTLYIFHVKNRQLRTLVCRQPCEFLQIRFLCSSYEAPVLESKPSGNPWLSVDSIFPLPPQLLPLTATPCLAGGRKENKKISQFFPLLFDFDHDGRVHSSRLLPCCRVTLITRPALTCWLQVGWETKWFCRHIWPPIPSGPRCPPSAISLFGDSKQTEKTRKEGPSARI